MNSYLTREPLNDIELDKLILTETNREKVDDLILEQQEISNLRKLNLEPRNRILISGPPGSGKTALAQAIANQLEIPILTVRHHFVPGANLNETARNLEFIAQKAQEKRSLLLLDNIQSTLPERDAETTETPLRQTTRELLRQAVNLATHCVVVVTANHITATPPETRRCFQLYIQLQKPSPEMIRQQLKKFQERTGYDLDLPELNLPEKLSQLSFRQINEFALDVLRHQTARKVTLPEAVATCLQRIG